MKLFHYKWLTLITLSQPNVAESPASSHTVDQHRHCSGNMFHKNWMVCAFLYICLSEHTISVVHVLHVLDGCARVLLFAIVWICAHVLYMQVCSINSELVYNDSVTQRATPHSPPITHFSLRTEKRWNEQRDRSNRVRDRRRMTERYTDKERETEVRFLTQQDLPKHSANCLSNCLASKSNRLFLLCQIVVFKIMVRQSTFFFGQFHEALLRGTSEEVIQKTRKHGHSDQINHSIASFYMMFYIFRLWLCSLMTTFPWSVLQNDICLCEAQSVGGLLMFLVNVSA